MKVTVYTFIKSGEKYLCGNDKNLCVITPEMFACMDNQYRLLGYTAKVEGIVISYTKVEIVTVKKIWKKVRESEILSV